ncbi:hypothetical protein F4861DRAFT_542787 [Xylaria intraflava]|nr:hypothetical protein F4861DRAFT_542787 [Xylaria intraflava]
MASNPPQNEVESYMLPSIFSPWSNGEAEHSSGVGNNSSSNINHNNNSRNLSITAVDPNLGRPSMDSIPSPSPIHSSEVSDISRRRGSSILNSPQSLKPPTPQLYKPPLLPKITQPHATSVRSAATAETLETEQQSTLSGNPTLAPPTTVSNVDAVRNTAIMPVHPEAESISLTAMYNSEPSPISVIDENESHADNRSSLYSKPQFFDCYSRHDVYVKRWSWIYVTLLLLSIYSTVLSGIWLAVSIVQPRYGRSVSTGRGWQLTPSTATLLATLAAKTIELSFVTVFVAVLGQVLTRRAFSRLSRGITLAEMTMRNWVIQPGSLLIHWEGIPYAAPTVLGVLTLTATVSALFYTTASDAMVSPKLMWQGWSMDNMQGLVKASYSNPFYISASCQTPLDSFDMQNGPEACLDVLFSGQSYHSLIAYMSEWAGISDNQNSSNRNLMGRPTGKHNLLDNTTMDSSWIETQYGDPAASFKDHNRIINNVTLAMPHTGVYSAATDPINGILQPNELLGLGQYSIRASVVSPVVNVMCVNMNKDELAPLVYTEWPNARTENTEIPGQKIGVYDWENDVPPDSPTEWLNRTVVDDIFKWGEQYDRRPPVFQLYPIDYNIITYASKAYTDSLYLLSKSSNTSDYTICQLRSWVTPKCSTAFDLSGTSGGYMKAHCEDPGDINAYERAYPDMAKTPPQPSGDWRNVASEWRLSINLNAGTQNSNASNARVLTSLILTEPELNQRLPSMAEAVAVLATSTLAAGSQDSTFKPVWTYNETWIPAGIYEPFRAQIQTQQYASSHTASWQAVFYPILAFAFVLNVLCLLYLILGTALTSAPTLSNLTKRKRYTGLPPTLPFPASFKRKAPHAPVKRSGPESDSDNEEIVTKPQGPAAAAAKRKAAKGLVTDYTEPQNLFALGINSPPSRSLAGSCGDGPNASEMRVPWRIGYAADANHYFFEDVAADRDGDGDGDGGIRGRGRSTAADVMSDGGQYAESYRRLSTRPTWL